MIAETSYKGCPVTVQGMGINSTGYHGAFTRNVEEVIGGLIESPRLRRVQNG